MSDYLTNIRFHLLDVSLATPVVFNLSAGFRSITAPEINVETRDVKEGTYEYPKHVTKSASVSDIELHQGVQFFSSDFYDWISASIRGKVNMRRNLLLIQFSDVSPFGSPIPSNGIGSLVNAVLPLNDLVTRVPARAWVLRECIPVRYKAGTDFDALGGDISIAELTLRPNQVDEISLGL
jgi:phage tail-like protein